MFESLPLDEFWIKMKAEYDNLSRKAIQILLHFSSTYLCESAFSSMTIIKTKQRNRLDAESSLRVALSDIEPRIKTLAKKVQH